MSNIRAALPARSARKIATAIGILSVAIVLAVLASGTTYALWNGRVPVNAATVTSGSTSVTINGAASYSIPGLELTKLSPGQSVVAPLTIANTGTTPLSASIASISLLSQTKALASYLTVRLTPSTSCSAGLLGGISGPLTTFTSSSSPFVLVSGATLAVCLEIQLNGDVVAGAQGGTASFTLNLAAVQVRKP